MKHHVTWNAAQWMDGVRRVITVASCEWRLQQRGPALWLALALVTLATAFAAVAQGPAPGKVTDGALTAVATCQIALVCASMVIPLLLMNLFERDQRRRMMGLIWSRPVVPAEYALGKTLAGLSISLFICLVPLLAGWLSADITFQQMQPLGPWLSMLPSVSASMVLVTAFALVCLALAPWPVLGALISSGIFAYLALFKTQSLLTLTDIFIGTVYYSPSIGFGPDSALVTMQRVSALVFAFLFIALIAFIWQIRQSNGVRLPAHWFTLSVTLVLLMAMTLMTLVQFQATAAHYFPLGPATTPAIQASITNYDVAVTLDPANETLAGNATFTLTPLEYPLLSFAFMLNPNLHIQGIALTVPADPKVSYSARFSTKRGWTYITLDDAHLTKNQAVRVAIRYEGHLMPSRDTYAPAAEMFDSGLPGDEDKIYDYLGNDFGFLKGSHGDWYPLPWVQQAISTFDTRLAIDQIQVTIPAGYFVLCPSASASIQTSSQQQVFVTTLHGPMPIAFLAFGRHLLRVSQNGNTLWYSQPLPDSATLHLDMTMIQELQSLDSWLGGDDESSHLIGVIVPLLQQPAVGPGMVFLPERSSRDLASRASFSPTSLIRAPAQDIAVAWWKNALEYRASAPLYVNSKPGLQSPDGAIVLQPTAPRLVTLLSSYSAAVITDQLIGDGFIEREMQTRMVLSQAQFAPEASDNAQITAQMMGLECCAEIGLPLALWQLEQQYGFSWVTQLLREFIAHHAQTPVQTLDLLDDASHVAKHDVLPEVFPYLCPQAPSSMADTLNPDTCSS